MRLGGSSIIFLCVILVTGRATNGRQSVLQQDTVRNHLKLDTPHTPEYSTFIEHFSAQNQGDDKYLADAIRKLHPEEHVAFTKSTMFKLSSYASDPDNQAILTKVHNVSNLVMKSYVPPVKRTDGPGSVGDSVSFQAYDLSWNSHEFRIYLTVFPEGYSITHQYAIIGGSEEDTELLVLSVANYARAIKNAILVFDQGFWEQNEELWDSVQKASWDDVILDGELMKGIQHEYKSFFRSEQIYKDLGVPWKRGVIFLGPPGNGKTISIKAIMKESGVPALYVKSFKSKLRAFDVKVCRSLIDPALGYAGDEFAIRQIFQRARAEAPCLLILEDLDSLVNDQNRSFFLNEVDGLEDNDGLLLLGTTNHFDRLDPALSNRPSRFDRKYNFPDPSKGERRAYALYWQNKLSHNKALDFPDDLLDEVAELTSKFSFAYLKEAFVSALLTIAGDESKTPPTFRKVLLKQIDWLQGQLGKDVEDPNSYQFDVSVQAGDPSNQVALPQTMSAFLIPRPVCRGLNGRLGQAVNVEHAAGRPMIPRN